MKFRLTLPHPYPFFVQVLANPMLSKLASQVTRTPSVNKQLLTPSSFFSPYIYIKVICSLYLSINLKGRSWDVNSLPIRKNTLPSKMHMLCAADSDPCSQLETSVKGKIVNISDFVDHSVWLPLSCRRKVSRAICEWAWKCSIKLCRKPGWSIIYPTGDSLLTPPWEKKPFF